MHLHLNPLSIGWVSMQWTIKYNVEAGEREKSNFLNKLSYKNKISVEWR